MVVQCRDLEAVRLERRDDGVDLLREQDEVAVDDGRIAVVREGGPAASASPVLIGVPSIVTWRSLRGNGTR